MNMLMIKKATPGKKGEALSTKQKRKGAYAKAKGAKSDHSPSYFLSASLSLEELETDDFFHFKAFRTP